MIDQLVRQTLGRLRDIRTSVDVEVCDRTSFTLPNRSMLTL